MCVSGNLHGLNGTNAVLGSYVSVAMVTAVIRDVHVSQVSPGGYITFIFYVYSDCCLAEGLIHVDNNIIFTYTFF